MTYSGSTCNVYQCGTTVEIGGRKYQGANATHSSITIGTVDYNAANNTLTARGGDEAIGISFGVLKNRDITFTGSQGTVIRNDVQYQQRVQNTRTDYLVTDRYVLKAGDGVLSKWDPYNEVQDPYGGTSLDCNGFLSGDCGPKYSYRWYTHQGYHEEWAYLDDIVSGEKQFVNTAGTYAGNCTTAWACLGGTPVNGASAVIGQNFKKDDGNTGSDKTALENLTTGGFIPGLDDCPGTTATNAACSGTNVVGSGDSNTATYGQQGVTGVTPTKTENRQWGYGTRGALPWFDASKSVQTSNVYQRGTGTGGLAGTGVNGIIPQTVPTNISVGLNPSPTNNFGSASIDGLLIQHLKLTTKGL